MKICMKNIRRQSGTTLMEVLIALFLTGIITTAILKLYVTQHRNYMVQDDITYVQQSARASIDELTRQIRMGGHQLPEGMPAIVAANTNPDTITVAFSADGCDTYLASPMPQPSSELKCALDISCFYDGEWVYIYDPDSGAVMGEWFEITQVQAAAKHLQHNTMSLSRKYDEDAVILSLQEMKFFIDHTTDPDHPTLMVQRPGRTPQIYADNITDLQFRYRLSNGTIVDEPVLVEDVREVLISVTGRSENPDYEDEENPYRHRMYSSSVNLRNLGN